MAHTDHSDTAAAGSPAGGDGAVAADADGPAAAGGDTGAGDAGAGDAGAGDREPPSGTSGLSAFAAAIERKKAAGQARRAHLDGSAKVGGVTSNHKTSRTFRRKSG